MNVDLATTLDFGRGFFHLQKALDLLRKHPSKEELQAVRGSGLLGEHELVAALYALNSGDASLLPYLSQLSSGAVPLFRRGMFPWGALPYPLEHAKLAHTLFLLGRQEIAKKMAEWQTQFACDHYGEPIFSLFLQERGATYQELVDANAALFEACPLSWTVLVSLSTPIWEFSQRGARV